MLHALPFEGTIKVRNKGVDIAILADAETVELAFAASRVLVVCGISTAVLEVTCLDPIDTKTLRYYEQTTPILFAMTAPILDAVRPHVQADTRVALFDGEGQAALLAAVRSAVQDVKETSQ